MLASRSLLPIVLYPKEHCSWHKFIDLFQVKTTIKGIKPPGLRLLLGWFMQTVVFLNNLMLNCFFFLQNYRQNKSNQSKLSKSAVSYSTGTRRRGLRIISQSGPQYKKAVRESQDRVYIR